MLLPKILTLALVTSLKSANNITVKDIEINVEKGVVYVSISDKLLSNLVYGKC